MMNILLPVDGSTCSDRAVDHAITFAGKLAGGVHLHLIYVHPPIPIGRVQAHIGHDTLQNYYREESETHLASARQRLNTARLAYIDHIHVGQPAEVIARQAVELGCELILMGTHGRSAVAGLVMGSVATRVLHLAPCPVLLVK